MPRATSTPNEASEKLVCYVVSAIDVESGETALAARDDYGDAIDAYAVMRGQPDKFANVRLYKVRASRPLAMSRSK